ncbi:hypothetical protein DMN91_003248 [Ooceraea biroi]|uniref:WD repeat-containing protein n=1 Tax=Ooceraea biroi TaxID=2015173 RepID=A0A026VWH1_OOCBI|nr:WD repeat-containing protein 3 [Ooceraea biroi]XP_026823941.1 WD repeat-containing protein 3 [Ooceraea biroi]EZA47881.1 WD repeat-containing protein [Ooceraea biroi]RLU25156.1 hypothetical protein DMN91_003248 [Ooceraea biroi]
MGLTKQYLRYVPAGNTNIVASSKCNIVFVILEGQEGRFVAVGACEHVYIWDLRLGEKAQVLSGEKACVSRLAASPDKRHIAVGYADGTVKTFDLVTAENVSIFVGHKSEITALAYDALGHRLATGSKDTDIIIWDIVAETGMCRLTGHKNVITKVAFMKEHNIIISASKDTFVKFWDLDTEHNFKTLVGHRSEVWSFVLVNNDQYLITACNDNQLRVWKITFLNNKAIEFDTAVSASDPSEENEESVDTDMKYPMKCEKVASMVRTVSGRVVSLEVDFTGKVIGCYGSGRAIELFYLPPDDVVNSRFLKRLKKQRQKAQQEENKGKEVPNAPSLEDEIKRLSVVQVSGKVKGLDLIVGKENELRLCVGLHNNSVELHSLHTEMKNTEARCLRSITAHGHREDVQAVCFSSDNLAFATVSGDSVKLWNRPTLACLRTVCTGPALSVTFVPGDRHLIVGLRNGQMLIIDIASGDILDSIPAHSKELLSIMLLPDLKGVVSGSKDQTVKFWDFELINGVLSVLHTRTLKLEESVLCVRISPNNRFVAVSLEDCTVKIFFLDTFKFFVSLYGHKLPVRCMDMSSDSTLIATGSDDRNVKIWGLDFGDCHKSLFAHDHSITGLSFVPGTHYFFTSGKDGKIKQWDADIFQKIITLQGHAGESRNCSVSPNGTYVASCGSDNVVRLYEKTNETLVLEDEAEEERLQQEEELATGESTAVLGQKQQALPSRKTVSSEKAAELILECLEISSQYEAELRNVESTDKAPPLPLLMQAYNCTNTDDFLVETFKRIRASDLEETLLLLTYSAACDILQRLPKLLKGNYQVELLARLALCLVQAHHGPIVANKNLLFTLEIVKKLAMEKISALRDTVGLNLHGMIYMQRVLEEREGVQLFKDATKNREHRRKVRNNKQKAVKRAVMNL